MDQSISICNFFAVLVGTSATHSGGYTLYQILNSTLCMVSDAIHLHVHMQYDENGYSGAYETGSITALSIYHTKPVPLNTLLASQTLATLLAPPVDT